MSQQQAVNGAGIVQPNQAAQLAQKLELVDKLIGSDGVAEYRLNRGTRDDLFEGLHDRSASLTVMSGTELELRAFDLEIERDLLTMELPRHGSPWSGPLRARLTGDDDDRLESPDEIAMMRNYRIAMDKARQSRGGGTLLKRLTQALNINELHDNRGTEKRGWLRRLLPFGGGR